MEASGALSGWADWPGAGQGGALWSGHGQLKGLGSSDSAQSPWQRVWMFLESEKPVVKWTNETHCPRPADPQCGLPSSLLSGSW